MKLAHGVRECGVHGVFLSHCPELDREDFSKKEMRGKDPADICELNILSKNCRCKGPEVGVR